MPLLRREEGIKLVLSTEDVFEQVRAEARKRSGRIKKVRYSAFNGGTTLGQLLGAVKDHLGPDFVFEGLVWDHRCSQLPIGEAAEVKTIARELARLDRFLVAHDTYDKTLHYSDLTELCCEYLLLGSRVLNRPARHSHHLDEIGSTVSLVMDEVTRRRNGSVIVRKSPFYVPGRIIQVDELLFFSPYLHSGLIATAIGCRASSQLYQRLDRHFDHTWAQASGPAMTPLGRLAEDEVRYWSEQTQPPAPRHTRVFLNYRREDSAWPTGRLHDVLIGDYGREGVFMDASIRGGDSFPTVLRDRLNESELMISMIGPNWLDSLRRHDPNKDDWVCREIVQALSENKPILPLRVDATPMPAPESLPETIRPLSGHNALELCSRSFAADIQRVRQQVHAIVPME